MSERNKRWTGLQKVVTDAIGDLLPQHEIDKLTTALADHTEAGGTVLDRATALIHGDRLKDYGHPTINFKRIASSWSEYLGKEVSMVDVCNLMILLKAQRMAEGYHRDTAIDIAGYAALTSVVAGDDEL